MPPVPTECGWCLGAQPPAARVQRWERATYGTPALNVLMLALGVTLVAIATADALHTLITTRRSSSPRWPTNTFYRKTWQPCRRLAQSMRSDHRRESFLALYAPLSLLGLLLMWVTALIVGWALAWWAMRDQMDGVEQFGDALYFSGVAFFTVGFGDVLPVGFVPRVLVLFEAMSGLTSIALLIGYLPTLFSAYSDREAMLLTLDDLADGRITPLGLVVSIVRDGDPETAYPFFAEWERWTARLLQSHTTYPMLMLFRSQHTGQSWLTGLGLVTDAAVTFAACVPGADTREPMRMYRRGARTFEVLGERFRVTPSEQGAVSYEQFQAGYGIIASSGMALRPMDESFERVTALRATYIPEMEGLIDALLAPRGFWSHPVRAADPTPHEADS